MKRARPVAAGVESVSHQLLGKPYVSNPLTGSAEQAEVFTAAQDGFDCVTFVESVVARAFAANAKDFALYLRRLRYASGRVDWKRRNHYMTQWIRNNARAGLIQPLRFNVPATTKNRTLDVVPGLPPQRQRFSCIPKRQLSKIAAAIHSGDLIFFASTRPHLDVFHCGIVIRDADRLLLRHASRSQGGVVEQELYSFLKANRMAGVILARPKDR